MSDAVSYEEVLETEPTVETEGDAKEDAVESTYIILPSDEANLLASQDGLQALQWGGNVMLTLQDDGSGANGNRRIIKIVMAQSQDQAPTEISSVEDVAPIPPPLVVVKRQPVELEVAEDLPENVTLVVDEPKVENEAEEDVDVDVEATPNPEEEEEEEGCPDGVAGDVPSDDVPSDSDAVIPTAAASRKKQSKRSAHIIQVKLPPKRKRMVTRSKSTKKVKLEPDPDGCFCDICDKNFSSPVGLRSHMVFHTTPKCKGCKKVFESAEKRVSHQNKCKAIVKPEQRRFACDKCPKTFKTKCHLENHAHTHSEVKPYICQMCGQGFNQVSNLNYHITYMHETDSHGNEVSQAIEKFTCDICGKSLRSSAALDYHQLIHTNSKPFPCPQCRYAARSKSTLDDHIFNVHLKRNYTHPCKFCRTGFDNMEDLEEHLDSKHPNLVDGKKKVSMHVYQCDLCKKQVLRKSALANHLLREHSDQLTGEWWKPRGLKLFECGVCNKVMTSSTSLIQHEKHQHLEPQFECQTCGKKFCRKYNLDVHERTHSGEKPYKCDSCTTSFSDQANLIHHYKKQAGHCTKPKKKFPLDPGLIMKVQY